MARWTKEGWEQLESIAFNAYLFTGFKMSALRVMEDAKRVCQLVQGSPKIGKKINNIFGEERFWHPFHEDKVLIWKMDNGNLTFVGAYNSLPDELLI